MAGHGPGKTGCFLLSPDKYLVGFALIHQGLKLFFFPLMFMKKFNRGANGVQICWNFAKPLSLLKYVFLDF